MPDRLEQRLHELGPGLEYPPTPDLAAAVALRLAARRVPGRARWTLVLAAALVLALAAALAVPQARSALLELFGLRGAEITRVDELPRAVEGRGLELGEPVSLAEARRRVSFALALPRLAGGRPRRVHHSRSFPGGAVSLALRLDGRRLVLTQVAAVTEEVLIRKLASGGTRIERVRVGAADGYWLAGRAHVLLLRAEDGAVREERPRLAGNVLLWQRGRLLLRLEGAGGKEQALRVARSVR